MKYREGDVVSCVSKIKVEEKGIKEGTIWLITSSRVIVLDKEGFLHECQYHEVFTVNKDETKE